MATITVNAGGNINTAIGNANSGDTVLVKAGTYDGRVTINKAVTVKTTENAKIRGNGNLVYITANNATLDGFQVERIRWEGGRNDIVEVRGSGVTVKNCTVYIANVTNLAAAKAAWGNEKASGIILKSNNITIDNCEVWGANFGVACSDNSGRNSVIKNCYLHHTVQSCIRVNHNSKQVRGLLIEGCRIINSYGEDGIQFMQDFADKCNSYDGLPNRGTVIRNCEFESNGENDIDFKGGYQILVEDCTFTRCYGKNDGYILNGGSISGTIGKGRNARAEHIIIRNCVCFNGANGFRAPGKFMKYYNNTIINNNFGRAGYGISQDASGSCSGMNTNNGGIANNLISNNSGDQINWVSNGGYVDYNLYCVEKGSLNFKGADKNWDQWRASLRGAGVQGADGNSKYYTKWTGVNLINCPANPTGNVTDYDFRPATNSPAYRAGGPLTFCANSGNSNKVPVQDATWFCDGYNATSGDTVTIGTTTATITAINGNTLTLNKTVNFSNGMGVYWGDSNQPNIGILSEGGGSVEFINASFSADSVGGEAPLTVNFTDSSASSSTITSRSWKVDGVEFSTGQNPSYQFTSAGSYDISLTVTSAAGTDTETFTDYITVTESIPTPSGEQLTNYTFDSGTTGWLFTTAGSALFSATGGTASIDVTTTGGNTQLYQSGIPLVAGVQYYLSVTGSCDSGTVAFRLRAMDHSDPFTVYLSTADSFTTSSQTFTITGTIPSTVVNGRITLFVDDPGGLNIESISFTTVAPPSPPPDPSEIYDVAEIATATCNTVTGPQVIPLSSGITPTAAMFVVVPVNGTGSAMSIGFADNLGNQTCGGYSSYDNQPTTSTYRRTLTNACATIPSFGATTEQLRFSIVSMGLNEITINVDEPPTTEFLITVHAFEATEAAIGWTAPSTVDEDTVVATAAMGAEPDLLFTWTPGYDTNNYAANWLDAKTCFGVSDGTTSYAIKRHISDSQAAGTVTSDTRANYVYMADASNAAAAVFNATGWTLQTKETAGSWNGTVGWMALRFANNTVSVAKGSIPAASGSNSYNMSQDSGYLGVIATTHDSVSATSTKGSWSIGGWDGNNQASVAVSDQHAADPTQATTRYNTAAIVDLSAEDGTDGKVGVVTGNSSGSAAFTWTNTDVSATPNIILWSILDGLADSEAATATGSITLSGTCTAEEGEPLEAEGNITLSGTCTASVPTAGNVAEIASADSGTTTGNVTFTFSSGITPTAAMFFTVSSTGDSMSIGFADSSGNQTAGGHSSQDNAADTYTTRRTRIDACLTLPGFGSTTEEMRASIVSMSTNQVVVSIDNAPATSVKMICHAFEADEVAIGWTAPSTTDEATVVATAAMSNQPDLLFTWTPGYDTNTYPANWRDAKTCFGVSDGTTSYAIKRHLDDGNTAADVTSDTRASYVFMESASNAAAAVFDSAGWDMQTKETAGSWNGTAGWMALYFASSDVVVFKDSIPAASSTETHAITQASGFAGAIATTHASVSATSTNGSWSIGGWDGTNQMCISVATEHASDPTQTASQYNLSAFVDLLDNDGTTGKVGSVDGNNGTSLDVTYTNTNVADTPNIIFWSISGGTATPEAATATGSITLSGTCIAAASTDPVPEPGVLSLSGTCTIVEVEFSTTRVKSYRRGRSVRSARRYNDMLSTPFEIVEGNQFFSPFDARDFVVSVSLTNEEIDTITSSTLYDVTVKGVETDVTSTNVAGSVAKTTASSYTTGTVGSLTNDRDYKLRTIWVSTEGNTYTDDIFISCRN